MPYSYATYTGNGATTQFALTFPYIRKEHVKVYVNYVDTAYTWLNDSTVQLASAPANGLRVEVRRLTPLNAPLVDYADGSTLVAADLDTANLQQLYLQQELDDDLQQTVSIDPATGLPSAGGQRITNVGTPTQSTDAATKGYVDTADALKVSKAGDSMTGALAMGANKVTSVGDPTAAQDAATKNYVDNFVGQTANIANNAVTTAKVADSAITSVKIADGTIVAGDLASDSVTTAKILNANVTTAKIADLNVTTGKIADLGVTTGKIADAAVTAIKIASSAIDSTKLDPATVVTNSEHSGSSPNDTSFFTTSAADARYFRQDSSETISSGQAWSSSDSYVATTAAIDARIIDLVDDVGGFVPIANEVSFPAANPDINNPDGTGTIVSIKEIATTRTPSSGTVTIANGSGSNTVTITGCGSTVLASGFGVLVETTSTLHTYTFHRLVPKATEVTTVASISADITTVAGNNANVTAVAGNATNINTVAGSIANVNAVGGSIANVNSVASNLASVNSFANTYRIAASDPATSLDVGDLVFNTTANELRVYNGSVWQGGVTATGNLVSRSGDTMTGALAHPLGAAATPSITFTGDTNTGIYSPGADQVAISTNGQGRLYVDASGNVGVGVAAPANPVDVLGSSGGAVVFNGRGRTSDNIGVIRLSSSDSATEYFRIQTASSSSFVGTSGNTPLLLNTNGTERLRITSTGTVNIVGAGTAGSTQAVSFNGSAPVNSLVVDSSGRLGIGTSSPSATISAAGADGAQVFQARSASGWLRIRPYVDATNGALIDSTNAAESAYQPLTLYGSTARLFGSNGTGITVDSSGRVGIGTTSPSNLLHLSTAGASYLQIQNTTAANSIYLGNSSGNGVIQVDGANSLNISTNGSERARIDSSGRLLVGTSSSPSVGDSQYSYLVVQGYPGGATGNANISLQRGETAANITSGEQIGDINFTDSAGYSFAKISCLADANAGTNDYPGRLVFSTTADGAASPTERFRIGSAGQLGIGGATYGTAGQVLTSGGASAAPTWGSSIVSGTAVASTSGTSIDFTGIPSWVKRVTVMFSGVSTNGTSIVQVQLGTSSGFETSSYLGTVQSSTSRSNFSSGFLTTDTGSGLAAYTRHGLISILLSGSNTWTTAINIGLSNQSDAWVGGGSKTLSGTLDRIRITTVNGTDTFDAGSINILYE